MENYLGEIRTFAGNYAPVGWVPCDGRLLSISDNEPLYSLIGVVYGGDGITKFAVPNLLGRVGIGLGTSAGSSYALGQQAGTENVTLRVNELPAHTHSAGARKETATTISPQGAVWAAATQNIYSSTTNNQVLSPNSIVFSGGNQSHNNMMPYLALTFFIATFGVYPPRQ